MRLLRRAVYRRVSNCTLVKDSAAACGGGESRLTGRVVDHRIRLLSPR